LEKVIKYRCSECGDLFDTPEKALAHEIRHERIKKANDMLNEGCTLKQINDECEIWESVPKHLENVNKDNCFKISYWQCCDKPAYQIVYIYFDGTVNVRGCGSWNGYYGNPLRLDSRDLKDSRSKEELFVDSRYTNKW
jgi:hypothetical protein